VTHHTACLKKLAWISGSNPPALTSETTDGGCEKSYSGAVGHAGAAWGSVDGPAWALTWSCIAWLDVGRGRERGRGRDEGDEGDEKVALRMMMDASGLTSTHSSLTILIHPYSTHTLHSAIQISSKQRPLPSIRSDHTHPLGLHSHSQLLPLLTR
jgi:hypothetical protein